jgi:hypothetical protein
MATELLGSDSILFPCTVSGVHHKALGIVIYQGYAVLWFGEEVDPVTMPQ